MTKLGAHLIALLFALAAAAPWASSAAAQYSSPIASPRVTSHFTHETRSGLVNYACTPITRRGHRGTDFGVPIGTTVSAAIDGTVASVVDGCPNTGSLSSRCGGGFGNHVVITDAAGRSTYYAHMSPGSIVVRSGQRVSCGDTLGRSGNSGRTTGPHLHFEIRSGASRIDPYGGPCSTQTASLWNSGNTVAKTCESRPRAGEDASFVHASAPDLVIVQPGTELTQRWTLRNSGTTTWSSAGGHRLERAGGPSLDALARLDVPGTIAPGANADFSLTVRAPSAPGTYTAMYRMASDATPGRFGTVVTVRLRVLPSPRSCRSATLGRDVPNGECVQVDYAGCGASSCAWFRCSNGAWLCTGEASCPGPRHEHASCADPNNGACSSAAEPCASATECCGGLLCASGATGARQCCAGPEMACEGDGDCCGRMRCGASGTCECVPIGSPASSTLECCGSAYRTRAGVCGYDT